MTRAGGDSGANPRKVLGFAHVETASAPAFGVDDDHVAPPEWIQLIPAGSFHGRDGRGPYLLSDPEAVIKATMALRMHAGIPIDYDHATDFGAPQGSPAPAAGWITEFAIRGGAIWGRVEWTERAARAIRRARVPLHLAGVSVSHPATAPSRACCAPASPTIRIFI